MMNKPTIITPVNHARDSKALDLVLITVIIPVYNVGQYLHRCIDSVTEQTYGNLEIILVDDGSTDNSSFICDEYAEKDRRIVVIHQKNMGVSTARNTGLKHSTGDYISFVDADDEIEANIFSLLIDTINMHHFDVISYNTVLLGADSSWAENHIDNIYNDVYLHSNEAIIRAYINNKLGGISTCSKLFSSSIVRNIRFDIDLYNNEDKLFIYHTLKNCNNYAHINKLGYKYFKRKGSASSILSPKHLFGIKYVADTIFEDIIVYYPQLEIDAKKQILESYILLYRLLTYAKNMHYDPRYTDLRKSIIKNNLNDVDGNRDKLELLMIKYISRIYTLVVNVYMKKGRYIYE